MDFRAMGIRASELSYCPSNDIGELFGTDPEKCGLSIRLHSMLDSSQAPQGGGTVVIVADFPHDYMNHWQQGEGKGYEELKQSLANKLIASAEKVIPGLSQRIVYKRVATPITLEQATLNSQGSAMGWYSLPGGKMRSQKTPFANLYQAGHWTFPGGSVPAVVASGRNAARLVLKARQ
jgi:phytoene dehydrogenase-like protein